jgi:hypothetical protein
MSNQVYANNMEVSCKAAAGKSICAFPDVCFTPPTTPATPPGVPIPYPNTGMASDTTSGSTSVKISGKEVMLKNKSYFKKSMGDEAGCAPKKGVITSKNMGKVYFTKWSMDVKVEGENVVRMMDLTTHNHGSVPGNTATWPYLDEVSMQPDHPCIDQAHNEYLACKEYDPYGDKDPCESIQNPPSPPPRAEGMTRPQYERTVDYKDYQRDRQLFYAEAAHDSAANDCLRARRCMLVPYSPTGKQKGCCGNKRQTGHHLIEASAFFDKGRGGSGSNPLAGCGNYSEGKAPSVCTEGTDHGTGTHGLLHTWQSDAALACPGTTGQNAVPKLALDAPGLDPAEAAHVTTYEQARENGIAAMQQVFPESNCDADCLRAQLDAYHVREAKIPPESRIQAVATTQSPDINEVWDMAKSKLFG